MLLPHRFPNRLPLRLPFGATCLFGLVLAVFSSPLRAEEPVTILADPHFAEGFGAAFIYGSEYSGGRRPPLGEVTAYRDISPWQVHLIPDGPVKKVGVKTYPWDFQEGLHHDFVDKSGRRVRELHAHRLVVNHVVEANTPEKLQFAQFNNYRLPKDHPDRDQKLVKRITSDRRGKLTIHYNSKNEIRNAAIAHSARWARDTWPHLLVNQRFTEPVNLSAFDQIALDLTYRVDKMEKLSNWPNMIKGAARSGMNLKFMFFLRNRSDLEQKLFVGMMLFTSREKAWAPHLGIEQHGTVFYRDTVAPDGTAPPKLGEPRRVQRDIRSLVAEALRLAQAKQPELSEDPDDYAIYNFSIGLEGMGHWETDCEISGLSLKGTPKEAPPAPQVPAGHQPLIECDAAMLERARERLSSKKEPFYSYWQLAKAEIEQARAVQPSPTSSRDPMEFHNLAQAQGTAARLLAYAWQLEGDEAAGDRAVELLDTWASSSPMPGTDFDPAIRFPNAGMDVARSMLPFVVAFDLLRGHPSLNDERRQRIESWFRALVGVVKQGIARWEENGDFGGQHFQNHHVAHTLGLAIFGAALGDDGLIQLALDSPDNPKDFHELLDGLILMPDDTPHGGLRGKPLNGGEIQDRVRTNHGNGLTYCHLSLTLMLYTAEVLGRASGEDCLQATAPGGETLSLSAAFYSDFFRLRNARLNGDYYFRDHSAIQNHRPYFGTFEVALRHWPTIPNLRAIVRSSDRARTPRSWLCYYGLPVLTHGVDEP